MLSRVLAPALERARERDVWLPVRPVTRRRWPNGRVTHDELKPLKALAARMPCPYLNLGRYVGGRPMVQGMRVALSSDVRRTHEELVERILHAGLAYSESVDPETSMVICNESNPLQGKGFTAAEYGVPVVPTGSSWTTSVTSSVAPASSSSPIPPLTESSSRCSDARVS